MWKNLRNTSNARVRNQTGSPLHKTHREWAKVSRFALIFIMCSLYIIFSRAGRERGRGACLTLQPSQRRSQWSPCQTLVQSTGRDDSKCPLASRECVTHTTYMNEHTHRYTLTCISHAKCRYLLKCKLLKVWNEEFSMWPEFFLKVPKKSYLDILCILTFYLRVPCKLFQHKKAQKRKRWNSCIKKSWSFPVLVPSTLFRHSTIMWSPESH